MRAAETINDSAKEDGPRVNTRQENKRVEVCVVFRQMFKNQEIGDPRCASQKRDSTHPMHLFFPPAKRRRVVRSTLVLHDAVCSIITHSTLADNEH